MQSAIADAARTGTIEISAMGDRCRRMKFDNDDGRVIENFKPCDNVSILDANGVQVPVGTIRRLDAISKSFSQQ